MIKLTLYDGKPVYIATKWIQCIRHPQPYDNQTGNPKAVVHLSDIKLLVQEAPEQIQQMIHQW